jgi:neutral ceramidase
MGSDGSAHELRAGAAVADLTPRNSVFLFGYPHVPRWSTGVHDPLEAAAVYLAHGGTQLLIIATDLIFVPKPVVARVRERVTAATGVPGTGIAITATHTHSGPLTTDYVSNRADPVVPATDPHLLDWITDQIVGAACQAVQRAGSAEAAFSIARAEGVGTNRHDPAGPADPDVPVVLIRRPGGAVIACLLAYAMHPTVLHEDSTLISGDFPYFTKAYLKQHGHLPADCVVAYHNGASGNQSPRHMTRANTFAEAQRLGERLGSQVAAAMGTARFCDSVGLHAVSTHLDLAWRDLPPVEEARQAAAEARRRYERLRASPTAPRTEVRTAECDWFGAEESVALAMAAAEGSLAVVAAGCLPAEIQIMQLGPWKWVFWPGEFFVEYALQVKAAYPGTFVITLANGELQGYIATPDAVRAGLYEARNAVFDACNGDQFVQRTLALLARMP